MQSRTILLGVAFGVLVAGFSFSAGEAEPSEEDWPTEDITIVVPHNPGGSTDTATRALANAARPYLNDVPIIIENRGGGVGVVGTRYALTQPDDGHTLVANWGNVHWTFGRHVRDIPFDPMEELRAVSGVVSLSVGLSVPVDSPFQTVEELVSYAKEHPGELTFATAGRGGAHWLAAVSFFDEAGIEVREIASEGGGPDTLALVGGERVDMGFFATFVATPYEGDRVRTLAVAFPERDPQRPDVPTFRELGYDVVSAEPTQIVATHATVPDWKVERLSDAFLQAMDTEEFKDTVASLGLVAIPWDYKEADEHAARMDQVFEQLAQDLRPVLEEEVE